MNKSGYSNYFPKKLVSSRLHLETAGQRNRSLPPHLDWGRQLRLHVRLMRFNKESIKRTNEISIFLVQSKIERERHLCIWPSDTRILNNINISISIMIPSSDPAHQSQEATATAGGQDFWHPHFGLSPGVINLLRRTSFWRAERK